MKAPKLGNVWTANAKIQVIADGKWKTLATCMDTPKAIRSEVIKLVTKGRKLGELWVVGSATDRKMVLDFLGGAR